MYLRKFSPLYAADDGGTVGAVEAIVADPPAAVVADPVIEPEPDPEPAPKKPDPLISTITGLRAKTRDLESENERLRRENTDAKALADRLAAGKDPTVTPTAPRAAPVASDDEEIDRRAAARVFARDAQTVSETGLATYGRGWVDAVSALDAYGVNSADFVSSVMEIAPGRTHEIMYQIAQDGEKAIALANMTPARRAAEITRMSMAAAPAAEVDPKVDPKPLTPKPAAKTVSKAPAPPPPVEPSASKTIDWRGDDASDEEFTRGFNEMMAKRSARR